MDQKEMLLLQMKAVHDHAVSHGHIPIAFMMSAATIQLATGKAPQLAPEAQSVLKRMFDKRKPSEVAPGECRIHGIAVVESPEVPYGQFALQTQQTTPHARNEAPGYSPAQPSQAAEPQIPDVFQEKVPVNPTTPEDGPLLSHLVGGDSLTPTDMLMKAMDNIDSVQGLVVIRLFKNGNIDMCANINKFELQGALQHAQMWAMHGGN